MSVVVSPAPGYTHALCALVVALERDEEPTEECLAVHVVLEVLVVARVPLRALRRKGEFPTRMGPVRRGAVPIERLQILRRWVKGVP